MTLIKISNGYIIAEHVAAVIDSDGMADVTLAGGNCIRQALTYDKFMDAFEEAISPETAADKKKK